MNGLKHPKDIFSLLREAFSLWRKDHASLLAGGIAYYSLFSIAPLIIILIAAAGAFFGSESVQDEFLGRITLFVGKEVSDMLGAAIDNASDSRSSTPAMAAAFLMMFIGAAGLFIQIKRALAILWGREPSKSSGDVKNTIKSYGLSILLISASGIILLLSVLLTALLSSLRGGLTGLLPFEIGIIEWVNYIVFFFSVTLFFSLVYKTLSPIVIPWGPVMASSAAAAALFTAGNLLLQMYLSYIAVTSIYGAASTLVVSLVWVYYSAQMFLFGAEMIKAHTNRYGTGLGEI